MDHATQLIGFFIEIAKFSGALFVAGFAYNKYIQAQIESIYKRMDENKKQYYENFVSKQLHDLEIRHQTDKNDDKFKNIIETFNKDRDHLEQKTDDKFKNIIEVFKKDIDILGGYIKDLNKKVDSIIESNHGKGGR